MLQKGHKTQKEDKIKSNNTKQGAIQYSKVDYSGPLSPNDILTKCGKAAFKNLCV